MTDNVKGGFVDFEEASRCLQQATELPSRRLEFDDEFVELGNFEGTSEPPIEYDMYEEFEHGKNKRDDDDLIEGLTRMCCELSQKVNALERKSKADERMIWDLKAELAGLKYQLNNIEQCFYKMHT